MVFFFSLKIILISIIQFLFRTNDRDYILSIFPGARFRAVEGAAHQIHAEYEELFVSEVEHFVNESR